MILLLDAAPLGALVASSLTGAGASAWGAVERSVERETAAAGVTTTGSGSGSGAGLTLTTSTSSTLTVQLASATVTTGAASSWARAFEVRAVTSAVPSATAESLLAADAGVAIIVTRSDDDAATMAERRPARARLSPAASEMTWLMGRRAARCRAQFVLVDT